MDWNRRRYHGDDDATRQQLVCSSEIRWGGVWLMVQYLKLTRGSQMWPTYSTTATCCRLAKSFRVLHMMHASPRPPLHQLMSSSPASVSIVSLKVARSQSAIASAILTLNITNFHPPQDGFVVIYMVRSSAGASPAQHHADDDLGVSDAGIPTFIDAVTYPGW